MSEKHEPEKNFEREECEADELDAASFVFCK